MKEISVSEIKDNAVDLIGKEWMLVAAGDESGYNMMTASWGTIGELWNKPVAVVFIRPQRYTYEFMEKSDRFTLSFYGEDKAIHAVCGRQSGRDVDKAALCGLEPLFIDSTVTFKQARMTLICRKLYAQDMEPECFIDKSLFSNYPSDDYHRVYVGEIERVLISD